MENIPQATQCFYRTCAQQCYIQEVVPAKSLCFPHCRWIVHYRLINEQEIPPPGLHLKRLFRVIKGSKPLNVDTIRSHVTPGSPATVTFEYAVTTCSCPRPHFEGPVQASPQWIQYQHVELEFENLNI